MTVTGNALVATGIRALNTRDHPRYIGRVSWRQRPAILRPPIHRAWGTSCLAVKYLHIAWDVWTCTLWLLDKGRRRWLWQ